MPDRARVGALCLVFSLLGTGLPATSRAAFPYVLAWSRTYDNPLHDEEMSWGQAIDAAGNVAVLGASHWSTPSADWLILKYDPNGNLVATGTYNSPANDSDEALNGVFDSADNLYVTGYEVRSDLGQGINWRTVQFSPALAPGWSNGYDGPIGGGDGGYGIALDSSDDVIVTGYAEDTSPNPWYDWHGEVYDPSGTPISNFSYDGPGSGLDVCRGVAVDSLDNATVVGLVDAGGGDTDWAIRQYDSTGSLNWTRFFSGPVPGGEDAAFDVKVDSSDNIIVIGDYTTPGNGFDWMVRKYDASGTLLWSRTHDGADHNDDLPWHVAIGTGDEVAVGGVENWNGAEIGAAVVWDSSGNQLWTLTYDGTAANAQPDRITGISFDAANNLIVSRWVDRWDIGQAHDLLTQKWIPAPVAGGALAAAVAVAPAAPAACQSFAVSVTITNTGSAAVNAVTLVGVNPRAAGTATYVAGPVPALPVSLAAGASVTCVWTYQAPGGTIDFSTTATGFDPGLGANIFSAVAVSPPVVVGAPPSPPSVSLTVAPAKDGYAGDELMVYTVDFANTGGDVATGLTIWDSWTPGLAFVSATNGGSGAAAMVSWAIPDLAPGATGEVQFTLRAPAVPVGPLVCGTTDQNYAQADFGDGCGAPQGRPSALSAPPVTYRDAVVTLAMQASTATVPQGSPVTFTITAANTCDDSAVNLQVYDTLPADYTFVTMPMVPGGIYASGPRLVVFSPVTLSRAGLSGSVYVLSFTASATGSGAAMCPHTASGVYANEAALARATVVSNPACVAMLVPHLRVTKTGPAEAATDSSFTYVVTISNTGSATAYAVALTDVLPAPLRFVSATGPAAVAGAQVTWTLPPIPDGGSASVSVAVHGPGGEAEYTVVNTAHVAYASSGGLVQPDVPDDYGTCTVHLTPVLVMRVFPSPYEPAVAARGTLKFTGLNAGATVRLYTVSGALVRALSGVAAHRLEWDGKDAGGTPVAAGIYLYEVVNPGAGGAAAVTRRGSIGVVR